MTRSPTNHGRGGRASTELVAVEGGRSSSSRSSSNSSSSSSSISIETSSSSSSSCTIPEATSNPSTATRAPSPHSSSTPLGKGGVQLNAEQERTGLALLEIENTHKAHQRRTQATFLTLCILSTLLAVVMLSVGLLDRRSVNEYAHDFDILEQVLRVEFWSSAWLSATSLGVHMTQPQSTYWHSTAPIDHFQTRIEQAFHSVQTNRTALLAMLEDGRNGLGGDTLRRVQAVHDTVFDYHSTLDRSWQLAKANEHEQAIDLLEGGHSVVDELERFYNVSFAAGEAVWDHVQQSQDDARTFHLITMACTAVLLAALLVCVSVILYRTNTERQLRDQTKAALQACRLADHHVFLASTRKRRVDSLSSSSSSSSSSDGINRDSSSVRQMRTARTVLRVTFVSFCVACVACCATTFVAAMRGRAVIGDAEVAKAMHDWGMLKMDMSYVHAVGVSAVIARDPFPALRWVAKGVGRYAHLLHDAHEVTCDMSHENPLYSIPGLDCQLDTDHLAVGVCPLRSFSQEHQAVANEAIFGSLEALRMSLAMMIGVTGRLGNKQFAADDPEVVAVLGAPSSSSFSCFSCRDGEHWQQSPQCSDRLVEALWYVSPNDTGLGLYDGSAVAEMGYDGFRELGLNVQPDMFDDMSSQKLVGNMHNLLNDPAFTDTADAATHAFHLFLDVAKELELDEVHEMQDWGLASLLSSLAFLVVTLVGCAVITYQERKRRRKEAVVLKEREWGLKRILECASAAELLVEFTSMSYCQENVTFWREVAELRHSRWSAQHAVHVYHKFIRTGAEFEINVSIECRNAIESFMEHMSQEQMAEDQKLTSVQSRTLLAAQRQVFDLLATNSHAQFVQWPTFVKYTRTRNAVLMRKMSMS